MAQQFTDQNFDQEVMKSSKPVLVDFWAAWCGPCQMMGPIIDELAEEMKDKVKIGKLNVDENRETASSYGVMSIPTFIVFKNGKPLDEFVGMQTKEDLAKKINALLK